LGKLVIGSLHLNTVRPLLKWAGGKRQLLPELRRFYPPEFGRYIEPFVGSGAVFFDLHSAGRLRDREAILIDSNADLIGCYETVRDAPDEVARVLDDLAAGHARGGPSHYYRVRDQQFNPLRVRVRRDDGHMTYSPELAAMLIYLNRTGFNGLFRLNASGGFNVPAGRYERPRISDREKLLRVAEALAAPGVRLILGSFESALDVAAEGDFLYFDPPYAPLSATSNFTSYTSQRFSAGDQQRLQRVVFALVRRGCHVVLSNSTAAEIERLYDANDEARAAGLRAFRAPARRAVNSHAGRRGPVAEYVITNIAAH
jgi:DNA adenine methylase